MPGKSVFLIGPGFTGEEVLDLLVQEGYDVTTLIRRESTVTGSQQRSTKTVHGSLDDMNIIQNQVAVSDIVIHAAGSRHLPSVEAILAGIQQRANNIQHTIYIYTSGATHLADDFGTSSP